MIRIIILFVMLFAAAPSYGEEYHDCRKIALIAGKEGSIRGAEDMAVRGNYVYISAYDRLALESGEKTTGGIYRLDIRNIRKGADRVSVTDMSREFSEKNIFHPHGIALKKNKLLVINRRDEDVAVEVFDIEQNSLKHRKTISSPQFCNANDVTYMAAEEFALSNDHGYCSTAGRWFENIFGLAHGNILRVDFSGTKPQITILADNISFANGVAARAGKLYVSATRGDEIQVFAKSEIIKTIKLNAAPDNISIDSAGDLLVALHPSLIRLGLYRNGLTDNAPSKIVKINNEGQKIIYDDPDGEVFSAATIAVQSGGFILIGSVLDSGIIVCGG